jgi:hypothetical protein
LIYQRFFLDRKSIFEATNRLTHILTGAGNVQKATKAAQASEPGPAAAACGYVGRRTPKGSFIPNIN